MNDTQVTLAGYVGGDVTVREAGGATVAEFRVATTPRRYNRKEEAWVDEDTQWYAVTAWRQLGENCALSLHRGDPVVIHGRMSAEVWRNRSGVEITSMRIEATFVGHDLNRGTTAFEKVGREQSGESTEELVEQGREVEAA